MVGPVFTATLVHCGMLLYNKQLKINIMCCGAKYIVQHVTGKQTKLQSTTTKLCIFLQ